MRKRITKLNQLTNYAMFIVLMIFTLRQAIYLYKYDTLFYGQSVYYEFIYVIVAIALVYLLIVGLYYLPLILMIELYYSIDLSDYQVNIIGKKACYALSQNKYTYISIFKRSSVMRC